MNATAPITDEARYRAAVGPRADYYVPRFLSFDRPGGSKASWNWPAFFVTLPWMLYRRMWSTALVVFLISIAIGLVNAFLVPLIGSSLVALVALGTIVVYSFFLIPIFANALYHAHTKRRIAKVTQSGLDDLQAVRALERGPHTSMVALILVLVLGVTWIFGILAAIAIPAYQDFTMRSQVMEGIVLASDAKAAVTNAYIRDGRWPADLAEAGLQPPPSAKYVLAVTVDHGTVNIEYGRAAHQSIAGHVLSLRPTLSGEEVVWTCGYATATGSDPATGAAGAAATDVPEKLLPRMCRE
jgi:type IV secretory pathway VirB2 component (pilin)